MKSLIDLKINVNLRDAGGATALMYSSFCGHVESVRLLLSAKADPTITNLKGVTALDLAMEAQKNVSNISCKTQGDYEETIAILTNAFTKMVI